MISSRAKKLKEKILLNKKVSALVFGVIAIALIAVSYFYFQYSKTQSLLQNPNQQAEAQAEIVLGQISKLIELPKGEKPTIATVSDKSKLLDQPFFKNAENGDKVLIYNLAKKAILFRPSTNKIIDVAPVNFGENQALAPTTAPTSSDVNPSIALTPIPTKGVEKVYKIAIYNGTLTAGLASSAQKDIESNSKEFEVIVKGDASKSDYDKTLVVDVSGAGKTAQTSLLGLVGGKVGSLPSGEKSPSGVDFVVIIGSSR